MAPLEVVDDLPSTERGAGGFGSTGVGTVGTESGAEGGESKKRHIEDK